MKFYKLIILLLLCLGLNTRAIDSDSEGASEPRNKRYRLFFNGRTEEISSEEGEALISQSRTIQEILKDLKEDERGIPVNYDPSKIKVVSPFLVLIDQRKNAELKKELQKKSLKELVEVTNMAYRLNCVSLLKKGEKEIIQKVLKERSIQKLLTRQGGIELLQTLPPELDLGTKMRLQNTKLMRLVLDLKKGKEISHSLERNNLKLKLPSGREQGIKYVTTSPLMGTVDVWELQGCPNEAEGANLTRLAKLDLYPPRMVQVIDNLTGQVEWKENLDVPNRLISTAFSPDGSQIVTSANNNKIQLSSLSRSCHRECAITFGGHRGAVMAVNFSQDGSLIATGSQDKTAKIWKLDGTCIKTLKGHEAAIYSVEFSPTNLIATGSQDKTVKLWQLDGTCIKTLEGHEDSVISATFSPNGLRVLTSCLDKTVKLWKLDGICLKTLKHEYPVTSAIFSPCGDFILTSENCNDIYIKNHIWNLRGHLLSSFKGGQVCGFSRSGSTLLTNISSSKLGLWDLQLFKNQYLYLRRFLRNKVTFVQALYLSALVQRGKKFNYSSERLQEIFDSLPKNIQQMIKNKYKQNNSKCLIS